MKAYYKKYSLQFKKPSGTSRGVLNEKETYFLIVEKDGKKGVGECAVFRGLSYDDVPDYEKVLDWVCENINFGIEKLMPELINFPSVVFGLEQAFLDLEADNHALFPSDFTAGKKGILTNGLIWMNSPDKMFADVEMKINQGFDTIKLKIGTLEFNTEIELLKKIREKHPNIQLRLDANGAFKASDAMYKLERLASLNIHSIEQPIRADQIEKLAKICLETPIPIALDEELIGANFLFEKEMLLDAIKPQYIILKPSLLGGFKACEQWITMASQMNIGWWVTSALESNVGLNAIAQWTYTLNNNLPQGLGTGGLFTNNFHSPLHIIDQHLWYKKEINLCIDSF